MGWKIYFWAMAAFLVLPLPYKLWEYATGRDPSPRRVKVEEMANAALMMLGLPALHAFAYGLPTSVPLLWQAWVALAVVASIAGLFWSPKVRLAEAVMGATRARIVMAIGALAFVPMLVGVARHSLGLAA
jgi:hypothetical protein